MKPFRRCLSGSVFQHCLVEFENRNPRSPSLRLFFHPFGGVCQGPFSCTGTWKTKRTLPTRSDSHRFLTTWCLFLFSPSLCRKSVPARPFEASRRSLLSYSGFARIAGCLLGAIFQHGLVTNANRHLRRPLSRVCFLIDFWPSLEVSVRDCFPAQAHGIQSRSH